MTFRPLLVTAFVAAGTSLAGDAPSPANRVQSQELHQTMMAAADKMKSMKMSGDLDHDFLMSMKQHHQDALEMSRVLLKHSKDPKVRGFAQKTIDMQTKDIQELDAMMARHPRPPAQGRPAPRR